MGVCEEMLWRNVREAWASEVNENGLICLELRLDSDSLSVVMEWFVVHLRKRTKTVFEIIIFKLISSIYG